MYSTAFAVKSPSWEEYARIRNEGGLLELRKIYLARLETANLHVTQDPQVLFFALKDLCDLNYDCGDFPSAAHYLCEAIRLDKSLCGKLVEEHAYHLVRLAYFYIRSHRIAEAELAFESAMSISTGDKQACKSIEKYSITLLVSNTGRKKRV